MTCRLLVLACLAACALPPAAHAAPTSDAAEDKALEALLRREVQGPSRYAQSLMDAPAAPLTLNRASRVAGSSFV